MTWISGHAMLVFYSWIPLPICVFPILMVIGELEIFSSHHPPPPQHLLFELRSSSFSKRNGDVHYYSFELNQ
jgi:hypothetical protein